MLWKDLPSEAKDILEWLLSPYSEKENTLRIHVGKKAPFSGILVTPELFSIIRTYVEEDIEEYEVAEFSDTSAVLRLIGNENKASKTLSR